MKRTIAFLLALCLLACGCISASADWDDPTGWDFSDWTDVVDIASCNAGVIGLRADGTLLRQGGEEQGLSKVDGWTGIRQILLCNWGEEYSIFGLREDGTVISTTDVDFSGWDHIIKLVASEYYVGWVAGLREDGSILVTEKGAFREVNTDYDIWEGEWIDPADWGPAVDIVYLPGWTEMNGLAALCADGTVHVAYTGNMSFTETWTDVVELCPLLDALVGLKKDGTLLLPPWMADEDFAEDCADYMDCSALPQDWENVVALCPGHQDDLYGLRADGRVEICKYAYGPTFRMAAEWEGIRSIKTDLHDLYGLREDGSVVYAGFLEMPEELFRWKGVQELFTQSVGAYKWILGLQEDGTVLALEVHDTW